MTRRGGLVSKDHLHFFHFLLDDGHHSMFKYETWGTTFGPFPGQKYLCVKVRVKNFADGLIGGRNIFSSSHNSQFVTTDYLTVKFRSIFTHRLVLLLTSAFCQYPFHFQSKLVTDVRQHWPKSVS